MLYRFSCKSLITLVLLITLLTMGFTFQSIAKTEQIIADGSSENVKIPDDSVLQLIPQDTIGVIYCPSLTELDKRINMLAADLMGQVDATNWLAKALSGAFGAGFESLDELELIGLDVDKDFAVFFSSVMPIQVAAVIRLTDAETMRQIIETEAEGAPTEYNGVTYWSSAEGESNFALLENTLVFSQQTDVCKNVIDIFKGTGHAITHNADKRIFSNEIIDGTDQLGVYVNIEAVVDNLDRSLEQELEDMTENLENENDPISIVSASLLTNMLSRTADLIEQLQFLSATIQVKDTDVQLKPFFKFRNGSEYLNDFKESSSELSNIEELPNVSMMNGAFQGVPKLLVDISTFWFDIFPKDPPDQEKELNPLFQEVKDHYESLADKWNMSMSFENSIVPDYLFIYELKDERSAKTFMDAEFLKQLHEHHDAYAGEVLIHNGVEIKSYIFPDFKMNRGEDIPEGVELTPIEWHWYYAFTDGRLYFTTGTNVEAMKSAIDRKTGEGDLFSGNTSYQKLVDNLGADNNVFIAFSPIIAIKDFLPILGKLEQEDAASIQMFSGMFTNLPDNYSIGFAAKTQDNGIDAKLLLTLGDFQQLIQLIGMVFGGGLIQAE